MNSLGESTRFDDLAFLATCPELRVPLRIGDFQPVRSWLDSTWSYGKPIEVACYRMPHSRAALRFFVRLCDTGEETRWHVWGDWCEYERTACDACYDFFDGGGSFATRASAEWAIHLYVAKLFAEEIAARAA